MKKISKFVWLAVVLVIISVINIRAEDVQLEKRQNKAIENFVISSRKSDGDYSTISLKNWRNELGIPFLSTEDMIRRVLSTFEAHYKNLNITYYQVVYANKPGPSGGIDCDFLIIRHETVPEKTYRFAARAADN